jgi:hypothetical protein
VLSQCCRRDHIPLHSFCHIDEYVPLFTNLTFVFDQFIIRYANIAHHLILGRPVQYMIIVIVKPNDIVILADFVR